MAADSDDGWEVVRSKKGKRRAQYEPTVTADALAETQDAFRVTARQRAVEMARKGVAKLAEENAGSKTVCLMFFAVEGGALECDTGMSGGAWGEKGQLTALRQVSGVAAAKQTICAEEHLLIDNRGGDKYLFSVAFDRHGVKAACSGCKKLLDKYGIEDLHPLS